MNIRIYNHQPGPVSRAFLQVFKLTSGQLSIVSLGDKPNVILLSDKEHLPEMYREDIFFAILVKGTQEIRDASTCNIPKNVFLLDPLNIFVGDHSAIKFVEKLEAWAGPATGNEKDEDFSGIVPFKQDDWYNVLVIDDRPKNLRLAHHVLKGQQVVTARSLKEGLHFLDSSKFHVVLSDMNMPPDKYYPSLNLDSYGLMETVTYGFAAIFEVTKRGVPLAIVTDGDHHRDWVSAMIDKIPGPHTVNGQKVMFYNQYGKRWDQALNHFMARQK